MKTAHLEQAARALSRLQWLDPTSPDDPEITALVDANWQHWTTEARAVLEQVSAYFKAGGWDSMNEFFRHDFGLDGGKDGAA